MFSDSQQHATGKWYISAELEYSIECLRFINELVQYDRDRRPFPDKLMKHSYLKCDLNETILVKNKLEEIREADLMCMAREAT